MGKVMNTYHVRCISKSQSDQENFLRAIERYHRWYLNPNWFIVTDLKWKEVFEDLNKHVKHGIITVRKVKDYESYDWGN
jgi:myo-inositol catabolism protein IolC